MVILTSVVVLLRHVFRVCASASLVISIATGSVMAANIAIPDYSMGKQEIAEQSVLDNYPVMTNLMKKINGVVTSDGAQWLQGYLDRQLYRVNPGQTSESVYQFFVQAIEQQGVNERFRCHSFSCGASNFWANDVFDIPRLYGLDRYQFYYIGEKEGQYISVYTVKRGNGRTYALIDIFTPQHKVAIPTITANTVKGRAEDLFLSNPPQNAKDIQVLMDDLMSDRHLTVILQGQASFPDTIDEFDRQLAFVNDQLKAIKKVMVNKGVNPEQIRTNLSVVAQGELTDLPAGTFWVRLFRFKNKGN